MNRFPRTRLSPAIVISTLALLVALAGTAYAATRLPANSVGRKQLRRDAVVSSKVEDFSLLARDFKKGQLPAGPPGEQGPQGETGPQGVPGPPGVSDREVVSQSSANDATDLKLAVARCPAGKTIVGGGAAITFPDGNIDGTGHVALIQSLPSPVNGVDWSALAAEQSAGAGNWMLTSYAVCAVVATS